jgi:hypothetical protein
VDNIKVVTTVVANVTGVYGLPSCGGENSTLCDYVRRALAMGAYLSFVQNRVVSEVVNGGIEWYRFKHNIGMIQ